MLPKKILKAIAKRYWMLMSILIAALLFVNVYGLKAKQEPKVIREAVILYQCEAWYYHSARVEKENPLFDVGTVLSNRDIYFSSISPNLTCKFKFKATKPMNLSAETKLVMSAADGITYWRKEEKISSKELFGKEIEIPFNISIKDVRKEIRTIQDSLDFHGGKVKVEVVTTIKYEEKKKTLHLSIDFTGSAYKVRGDKFTDFGKKEILIKKNTQENFPIHTIFTPIIAILMASFTFIRLRYPPIRPVVKEEVEYKKFKDFISEGKAPSKREKLIRVEINSLKDLVSIAIDAGERVILDKEEGIYFVLHGNAMYFYKSYLQTSKRRSAK